jgi:pyruvate-formate lyase
MTCIASGIGLPALYNDSLYVASLERHGIPTETARSFCLAGCSQVMIPGMCNFVNDIGMFNAAKVAELAMYGGFDPRTGVQAGPLTPAAEQCPTFDELMDAFYKQLDYFISLEVSIHNKEVPYRASREGYVMRSLFIRDCIEKGVGVYEGGARYNNIELEIIGITNAADHLYAIKKVVYDEQLYTMEELTAALKSNYVGYEEMREHLYHNIPKFGNDMDEIDSLRADITRYMYERFNSSPAVLGGVYVPGEVIFTAHEHCGAETGATADGRYAGTVLADSVGASQGRDKNGPTALMNSVLQLPVADYLLTSVVLNMRFLPQTFKREEARSAIQALFNGYFLQGGMQLQVNVCDADTLRAAQKNPEHYKSLIVRVGGYSDYFVRLSRKLQDEIIQRTAQGAGL